MVSYDMTTTTVVTLGRMIKIASRATPVCVTSTPTCDLVHVVVQLKLPPASLGASAPTNLEAVQMNAAVPYLNEMNKVREIRYKFPPDQMYICNQYSRFRLSHIGLTCAYSQKDKMRRHPNPAVISKQLPTQHIYSELFISSTSSSSINGKIG